MATEDDSDVPETGAVFTFGKSRFADNIPNKFWIRNDKVVQISCGDEHTALVAESGRVFTFGSNDWGQLGLGNTKPQNKPSCIKSLKQEKIKLVTCGRSHTVVATESGKLYSFGANGEGQLGIGDSQTSNCPQPQYIESLEPLEFTMLAAGADHTLVLTEDGDVYGWGANGEGQLGLKDEPECPEPKHIVFDEPITCVSCGYYHSAVITASGKLLTFGETDGGKLGLGDHVDRHTEPQVVSGIREKLIWVSCGGSHTVAVAESGKVYSFGDGNFGQLGHGTTLLQIPYAQQVASLKDTKITYSACGENHTALITERGQLITFGDGRHGKLGLGEENFANQFKPSKVLRFHKFIVDEVKCGGCHMLALAHLKLENGDWSATDEEAEEEELQNHKPQGLSALRNSEDMDLSGSFSARDRRRQKPDPSQTLTRTLPPLNNSFSAKALPPLSTTLPVNEKRNPLNRGKLPEITQDDVDGEVEKPKTKTPKDTEEDSDVSVTPEGESDDSENEMEKKRAEIKKQAEKTGPQPKPRVLPRIQVQKPSASSPRDLESEESEEEAEEKATSAQPVKAERAAPLKAIPVKSPRKSKDKKEESEEEEEEESEEEEKKKDVKKKKGRRKGKDEDSEEEDEEEGKDKKKDGKKKKGKGKKGEAEAEESEEEDDKKGKDKKKDKKGKEKKKKKGGIFGRKRVDSEEEDEEEESEEDKKKKSKKDDKKGKKKDKEEEDEEEDSEEGKVKSKKDKDAKSKGKDKKDAKKGKDKKDKDKEKEKEKEKDKDKKKGKDSEEEKEDKDKKTDKKNEENEKDKDNKDEKKKEPEKKEEKKKSRTCTLL